MSILPLFPFFSCVDYTISEANGDEKTLQFYRHINASEVNATSLSV